MDAQLAVRKTASFIRFCFSRAGRRTAVVGVSGGLDSAVALALCVEALGRKNVVAAFLPSRHTPAKDLEDARFLAKMLHVKAISFNIEPVLRAYGSLAKHRLPRANFSARARMAILYSMAAKNNGLVVGTGDKSEFMLGYFTKYGDGGADLFPLGGLYKTEVRELAAHLGIPSAIAGKPPSPHLWKGHTAQGELGFSYDDADAVLSALEEGMPRKQIESGFGKALVAKIMKRMGENQHKLSPAPICKI